MFIRGTGSVLSGEMGFPRRARPRHETMPAADPVVFVDGAAIDNRRCRNVLADFKVPRAVYFVDEFPTAELGKISKKDLRELADSFDA